MLTVGVGRERTDMCVEGGCRARCDDDKNNNRLTDNTSTIVISRSTNTIT